MALKVNKVLHVRDTSLVSGGELRERISNGIVECFKELGLTEEGVFFAKVRGERPVHYFRDTQARRAQAHHTQA